MMRSMDGEQERLRNTALALAFDLSHEFRASDIIFGSSGASNDRSERSM